MNLIQLQDKLKYEVSKQYLQPSVMIGSIYENLNTGELKYPVFNIDVEQIQEGSNDITYAIVAYYADRLIEDNSNKSNIKTDAITSMQLFIDSLRKSAGIAIETPVDIHLFEQQFVDKCAGSWVRLNLHTADGIDYCGETVDITVKEITENGKYDTSNYDYTIVNVDQSASEWGKITGDIENQEDLVKYVDESYIREIYDSRIKLNDYLYSVSFNNLDYKDAAEHFASLTGDTTGYCSLIRENNRIGRNFDWYINKQVEYIIHTPSTGAHYSVMGIALDNDEFKYLPFRLLDGINERGVLCSVNQLPYSDKTISINGTIPQISNSETVSMYMLVKYILDKFDSALEAAEYIRDYVKIMPIIGSDGLPMNFHYCIADKTTTIYLYFEGTEVKYESKPVDKFVMTNFRLAGTELVDGYYSITGSNIEEFGQGIERANSLLDNFDLDAVSFTKAYTTTDRLTDFAGIDGITITNRDGLMAIQSDAATLYQQELTDGTLRDDADLWQTVHSVIYDLKDKTIILKVQEIDGFTEFKFNPYQIASELTIAEDEKRSVQITEDEEGISILSACTTAAITPTKTVGYLDSGTVIPQGTSLQEILNKIFTKIRGLSGKTDVSGSISGITAATKEIGSTVDVSITASFTDGSWTNEGGWSNTHSGGKTTQPYGCTLTSYTYSGLISKAASTDTSISGSGTISSGSNTVSVVISYSASKNVPVNENGVALTIGKSNTTTTYVPVSASTITKTTESYTGKYKIFYSDGAVSRSSSSVWADAYKNKAKTVAAGGVFRIAVPSGMTITNIDEAFAGNKIYGGGMTNENITFVDNVENLSLDGSKYRVYTISNANGTNPWVLLNITVA